MRLCGLGSFLLQDMFLILSAFAFEGQNKKFTVIMLLTCILYCDAGPGCLIRTVFYIIGRPRAKIQGNCEEELPKKPVGQLSVDCRPSVGRLSADCWPTVGRFLAVCWPFVGRQLADRFFYQSADRRLTVGDVSVRCR